VVLSPILKVPSFTIPMGNSVEFAKSAAGGASFADISEQVTVADPDEIGWVFFSSFPAHTSRLEINGKTYGAGAASWPTEGITVPYAGLSVKIDPDDSGTQITLPFVAVNDYCIQSSEATLKVNWEPSNPLPVTIVAFDAAVSEQSVGLKWTTVQELTSSYFLIERSHDGKAWKGLDEVPAYGNSDELVAYDYVDETPIPGVNYYRLKMVDQDGTSAYSNRISVRFGDSEPLMVLYPNPVSEKLFIESKTWVAMESILIMDLHGRTVWDRSLETTPINQRKNAFANVGSWSEGIYLVEVRYQDGSRKLGRFLIRR
jgi:hypothetical protein